MKLYLPLLLSLLLLPGCYDPPDESRLDVGRLESDRFDVAVAGEFRDPDAYNSVRKIFVLTDRKTGREYVGITGVGIAETGRHESQSAAGRVEDER